MVVWVVAVIAWRKRVTPRVERHGTAPGLLARGGALPGLPPGLLLPPGITRDYYRDYYRDLNRQQTSPAEGPRVHVPSGPCRWFLILMPGLQQHIQWKKMEEASLGVFPLSMWPEDAQELE